MKTCHLFTRVDGLCSAVGRTSFEFADCRQRTGEGLKLIVTILLALFLGACGGGGGGQGGLEDAASTAIAKKIRTAEPNPTLVGGPITMVNTTGVGERSLQSIGALPDGGYAVAWVVQTDISPVSATLFMHRYGADGKKMGGEIAAPLTFGSYTSGVSSVAVLRDGQVVVAYSGIHSFGGTPQELFAVYLQIFDAHGAVVTTATPVNRTIAGGRLNYVTDVQVLALTNGGFVLGFVNVVWPADPRFDTTGSLRPNHTVYTILFGSGDPALVRETARSSERTPWGSAPGLTYSFAADAQGGFTVETFLSGSNLPFKKELADGTTVTFFRDTSGTLAAQRHDADGAPLGEVLTIATGGAVPLVAPLDDGGFALAWTGASVTDDSAIFTQVFQEELQGDDKVARRLKKKACLDSAKGTNGLKGRERKAFIDACLR